MTGNRRQDYGAIKQSFDDAAKCFTIALKDVLKEGASVRAEHVPLCMIALKFCRESNKHSRDNLVDMSGYGYLRYHIFTSPTEDEQIQPPPNGDGC